MLRYTRALITQMSEQLCATATIAWTSGLALAATPSLDQLPGNDR
jgi:hypothetical protein